MEKGDKKISIVTGASSGLGREIAKLLCEKEHVVYVIARRKELLESLKADCSSYKGEIKVVVGDLTDKKIRENLIQRVLKESKRIDYLINNAGYGKLMKFEDIPLKDIEGMYDLNDIAAEHLIQLALPSMRKRKEGRIINVASVVVFTPPAYFNVYNATKAAVFNFSRSLSYELVDSGVSISVLFPARMNTPFWLVALKCRGLKGKSKEDCAEKWAGNSTKPLKVAKYLVRHIDRKRLMMLPGFLPKFYYYFVSNVPFLNSFMMKHVIGPRTKKTLKGGAK